VAKRSPKRPVKHQPKPAPRPRARAPATGPRPDEPAAPNELRLIVGIGASAGGFEAFRQFLAHFPAQTGMALVYVQHLDPARKSLLVELLGRLTDIPVLAAEDGAALAPDRVYVIPPDATLTVANGALHLAVPAPAREFRRPIDSFLTSLAEDQGELAVGVILSGGGSDGTKGVRAIKENGGLTLAQASDDDHAMTGMPGSAAATGQVDFVLPVEAMPAKLIEYRRHLIAVRAEKGSDGTRQDAAKHLTRIFHMLRQAVGHDFSHYKEKTLVRRIQRRMQVLQIGDAPAYIEHLQKQPNELQLLFQELLIGVTRFFRDDEAFAALEHDVIAKVVEKKTGADAAIRVWVPGCATGEEAYSIAILIKEATIKRRISPTVQIFGTDIDDEAIQAARSARYRLAQVAGVAPARLRRWFTSDGDSYSPIREIREMCIFATHSVIKYPPFSRLDLVSCRNLLIYLDTDLQERLVRVFHYALSPGGFLFLGMSEGVGRHNQLFTVADKGHRIFLRRETASALADLPLGTRAEAAVPSVSTGRTVTTPEDAVERGARRVMERHTPAYVVVDRNSEILRFAGQTGRYLGPSPGAASLNLYGLLQRPLRPVVRTTLQEALATGRTVVHEGVAVELDGSRQQIDVIVEPLPEPHDAGMYIVAFRERPQTALRAAARGKRAGATPSQAAELEADLAATRARLQATIHELETANEEMKSANEGYQSVNEELQSANEELETSKEELQSVNEELQTVNTELSNKNDVLDRANSDLRNLLDSTDIATIFLDSSLCVTSFTPAATDLFPLRDSDRGRPITEIVGRLNYADLKTDVARVLRTLAGVDREVGIPEDRSTFIMRVRPYRTVDNVIDGVVVTFVDITEQKRREHELERLAAIVESSLDAIVGHEFDGVITTWNAGAEAMLGYAAAEMRGKPIAQLMPEDKHAEVAGVIEALRRGERIRHVEADWIRKDGTSVRVSANVYPVTIEGKIVAISWLGRAAGGRDALADAAN